MDKLDQVEVKLDGRSKTIRGAAARMIQWIAGHADFFNAPDVRGVIELNFAGEGACVTPRVKTGPQM